LDLDLEKLLDAVLHYLSPLLHAPGKGSQGLLQLALHLSSDGLVLLCHALDFSSEDVERGLEAPHLLGAERLSAE